MLITSHDGTGLSGSSAVPSGSLEQPYLIDVGDEFALSWHVDFLIVRSHLALDGKEENLQISFLCKSVETPTLFIIMHSFRSYIQIDVKYQAVHWVLLLQLSATHLGGFSTVL